ncbi:AraC family transcriptional regulator N-terminal domain-containing protein [Serratia plymuthica]|uniref:AraC family transcriptional regulator n=1 Tax=Serratia plymuthica TaxID=82996 RepID=A0A318P801_SERPL|nr:AraC family transcriptional regulator [Serratia plymuthica]AHY08285.1 AraC family transcriptional regulator [Serratia plymuthica]MBL3525959.1 AraC family transcriptional regulator [Serratia plymuthica]PYD40845.1 AraC family transcriptional regulator [Serratia plymuthica]
MLTHTRANNAALASLVAKIAAADGDYPTAIPALTIYRRNAVTAPMPCIYGLGLGLTVQGGKRVTLGNEIFDYGPGQSLITSVDLPVVSYVTQASVAEPYLGLRLELDARLISQLAADPDVVAGAKASGGRAVSVVELEDGLLEAVSRLVSLLEEPALMASIYPLILQEITIRLLNGQYGPTLRNLVAQGSPSQQIARVLSWLKLNFTQDLSMEALAAKACMSPSTFRQHFRALTGMSPLQYLKSLRLQEARQVMMNEGLDAGSAAVRVGYESASQFSREYTRLFGAPPLRDIKRIRAAG